MKSKQPRRIVSRVLPSQAMVILAVSLIVAIAAGVTGEILHRLDYEVAGTIRENTNLAYVLAEETSQAFENVDVILRGVAADIAAHGVASREAYVAAMVTRETHEFLLQRLTGTPQLDAVTLIAADGKLINFSRSWPTPDVNVADRDYFAALKGDPALQRYIGRPVQNRGTGTWTIYLARAIRAPDGTFIGLVLGAIALDHLERLYAKVALGPNGSILIARSDGLILVRQPTIPGIVGGSLASSISFRALTEGGMTFEGPGQNDGIVRIMAARPVIGLGLVVAVSQARDEALADWRRQSVSLAIGGIVIAGVIAAVFALLARRVARHEFAERMFRAALENMSQGIMMIDAGRRVQVCNQRAMAMLDLPPQLMARRPLFDDVLRVQWASGEFGTDGEKLEEQIRAFVRSGGIIAQPQTYQRARPNGLSLEIKSIPMEGGGIVRTFTDITGVKAAEAALTEARDAAHRSAQAKGEFLATMSHEIRSPMSGLLGVLEILRRTDLDEEQSRMTAMVHNSALSLLTVLNEILDFSKIEADGVAITPEPTDLRDMVQEVVQLHRAAAAPKGVPIELTVGGDIPDCAFVDGYRLRQIFNNLLSNAVKFTSAGTISVTLDAPRCENGQRLRLVCRDTGIGMSERVVARLFEPFMQGDSSTSRNFGGTGLGLSISRRLARLLGGDLTVTSAERQGSSFELVVPIVASDPHQAPDATSSGSDLHHALRGWEVLVVDDNLVNQWVSKRQLELLGLQVGTAANGEAAIAALKRNHYDLVLTDCHMPGMDGAELARAIRADADAAINLLPVIGLTADATRSQQQRCRAAGMSDVMIKPLNLDRCRQVLLRHLPGNVPIFDDRIYRQLFDAAEADGADCLNAFLQDAEARTDHLGTLTAGQMDLRAIATEAHALAGSSLAVGAVRLGEAARALERAARTSNAETDAAEVKALAGAIAAGLGMTRVAVSSFLATVQAERVA